MHRYALAVLLALSVAGLSGCGAKSTSTRGPSSGETTSETMTASGEASAPAAPGSTAWKADVAAYFAQWNAVDKRERDNAQALVDILKTIDGGEKPSKAQIAKQAEASKVYPQLLKDAQAITPPKELKHYHTLWLQTLAAGRDAMVAVADGLASSDEAKLANAGKLFDAATAAQTAQDAELARFNAQFKTSFK